MNVGYCSNQSHTLTVEGRKLEMSAQKKSSARLWFFVHVVVPLLPFFFEGAIRFVCRGYKLSWSTFSMSTLAFSYGLLFVFIDQSLVNQELPLMNEDKTEEKRMSSIVLIIAAMACFLLFVLIAVFDSLIAFRNLRDLQESVEPLYAFTLGSSAFVIRGSMLVQSKYNLKAVL